MKVSSNKTPEHTTRAIYNKGIRGISSILLCIKFRVEGQGYSSKSLAVHSLGRYQFVSYKML